MKWFDLPPLWLLGCAVLTWFSKAIVSGGTSWLNSIGTLLVVVGLALMVMAVIEMQRRKTTVIPHLQPSALVSSGIFARTRNPIYLGDALVLAGLALRWDAPLGLLLVPAFIWIIQRRFIVGEEARLQAAFGAEFERYKAKTRRWL